MMFFTICFSCFVAGLCIHRRHQDDAQINAVVDKVLVAARLILVPFAALYYLAQKVIADAQTKPETRVHKEWSVVVPVVKAEPSPQPQPVKPPS